MRSRRRQGLRQALLAALLSAGAAPALALAQSIEGAEGPSDLPVMGDGVTPTVPSRRVTLAATAVTSSPQISTRIDLGALDIDALLAQDAAATDPSNAAWKRWNRVGVLRSIARTDAPQILRNADRVERNDDGRHVWRMEVSSPGATAMRLCVCECDLPPGAQLYVYDANEPTEIYGPFIGKGPGALGEFMTPTVFTDRTVIEVRATRRGAGRRMKLAVDGVVHSYRELSDDGQERAAGAPGGQRALDCMKDVVCDSDWFTDVSRAVATFDFVQGGGQYSCSGTLLNDADESTVIPWFLTANHCVGTDRVARTVEVFWDFKASTCGGDAPRLSSLPRTNGATLAATQSDSDGSLLQLTGTLPSNRFFCGWTAETPAIGSEVIGVHHPEATKMRISYGTLTAGRDAGLHEVTWYDGVTAQGSSGSALFNRNKQVIGDLCCGGSYCNRPDDPDYYGRFDVNFAAFDDFLGASAGGGTGPGPSPGPGPGPDPTPTPTPAPTTTDLPPVQNLRASVNRRGRLTLRWKDKARGELGYAVEVRVDDTWVQVADLRRNARRFRETPGDGTHRYRVGPYDELGTAWSEITVTVGDAAPAGDAADPRDDAPTGATDLGAASSGQTAQQSLSRQDTADWYRIDLVAGRTYVFATTGSDDTMGALFGDDRESALLADNDDAPDGLDFNFEIVFTPETSGTYWLQVSAYPYSPNARYALTWSER